LSEARAKSYGESSNKRKKHSAASAEMDPALNLQAKSLCRKRSNQTPRENSKDF
jgi:hypothetical protein